MMKPTDFEVSLENTQPLPVLTLELQLDEALQRERAARIEIVDLMRQLREQAKAIQDLQAQLAGLARAPVPAPADPPPAMVTPRHLPALSVRQYESVRHAPAPTVIGKLLRRVESLMSRESKAPAFVHGRGALSTRNPFA